TDEKDRARLGNLAIPNMSVAERAEKKLERDQQRAEEQARKEEEQRLKEEALLAAEAAKEEEARKKAEEQASEISADDEYDDADFEMYQEPEEIELDGSRPQKEIVPDLARENRLYREVRGEHLGENLGAEKSFGGFGVKLKFSKPDGDEYIGHYNKDGLWVDEDGFVYNGYFDEEGNWFDYEEYDPKKEGHYNFEGKYVDEDGKEYNGYFDENGRWIDFTYIGKDGKEVDNGYFSEELGKWIPYGYFDEENIWKPYD
ncbi:MAG: hypothetical protein MJ193_03110, partial [Clostridia bacterium]|nr:hypothetical protein [Clostridia bacterium]